MGGGSAGFSLLNPSPNLIFTLVVVMDVMVAFVCVGVAVGLDVAFASERVATSVNNLWHGCSGALGAFFGLLGGSTIRVLYR